MGNKDWILLLVPIVCNGLLVFVFQKFISNKIDHTNKRNNLRDEIVILFWKKMQELNDVFIQINDSVRRNPEELNLGLETIKNKVIEIIQYYDKNKYDLCIFEKEYLSWENSWNTFTSTLQKYQNTKLERDSAIELGSQLQSVKDETQDLIATTRNKY